MSGVALSGAEDRCERISTMIAVALFMPLQYFAVGHLLSLFVDKAGVICAFKDTCI
jgi:hypothetical protein